MPRKRTLQTSFASGEIAPELGMRQDADQYKNGAKALTNMRCLIGGGVTRRPGTWWLQELSFPSVAFDFIVNQSTKYVLCFSRERMDAFLEDGTAAGSVTSAPWTGNIYAEMDVFGSANTVFLLHPSMPPQTILRTGAATWSRSAFTFFSGVGGRTEQPYYKTAAAAATLAPSALTGAVTITAAGATIATAAIGTKIRYLGREMLITNANGGAAASATVIETLPPTQTLTVTSSASFAVGEALLGNTSAAHGFVTGIPDGTHLTAVIDRGLTPFQAESLIGPNAVTAISAVANATPAAVTDWDEQLFSAVHGYPSCGGLHRNRLLFAGHPAVPDGLMASQLRNIYSFDVGIGGDGDAIFETIGDAGATSIVQLYSAEQLLIGTDRGLYYVPESQASPFRPSSISFLPLGSPWPITPTAKPRPFDDGVMFYSGSVMIMARPTGNLTQSWSADEVSLLSSHIIDNPTRLGVVSNFNSGPERYALAVNADGTMVALQLVAAQRIRNATPWRTNGTINSVACLQDQIFITTTRTVRNATRYYLERFDQSLTLDLAKTLSDLSGVITNYGAATAVNVVVGNYSLGTYPLAVSDPPVGPYTVGLFFNTRTETLPPAIDGNDGPLAGQEIRLLESFVSVLTSQRFAQNGTELTAYQVTDDTTLAPPLRTGPQRFQHLGWSRAPTLVITQPDPLPLTILAVQTEVAY